MAQLGQGGFCLGCCLSQQACYLLSHHHLFVDDLLGQIYGFQLSLIFFLGQLLLTGYVYEGGQDCIFLFYVHNVLQGGKIIFRIIHPLAMDVLVCVKYPLEVHRVDKFIQIHLQCLGTGPSKISLAHIRVFHDAHVISHNQYDVG